MYTPQRPYQPQPRQHQNEFDSRIGRLGNYVNNNIIDQTRVTQSASKVSSSVPTSRNFRSQEFENKRLFDNQVSEDNSNQRLERHSDISQLCNLISIKSNIGVENRRFAVPRQLIHKFNAFYHKIQTMHQLDGCEFNIYYADQDGERLPINNDDNLAKAIDATIRIKSTHHIVLSSNNIPVEYNPNLYHHTHYMHQVQQIIIKRPYLKLYLERKGFFNEQCYPTNNMLKCKKRDNLINMFIPHASNSASDSRPRIGMPEDFRQVSSIIDANILPATRRRVVLRRGGSDKPLGFYIRDGTYPKMNSRGVVEKNYGIFISRLVPGGLAESTNLLAVNDEILEVNGIEVGKNKRLDQVRDMMVANSSNLIITIRPAKPYAQHTTNRNRTRHAIPHLGRDRLASSQSIQNELTEDMIRHHIN